MKTIFMGNYWQTNNQQKEPIEWIVLKEEDEKIYLLSKYCLDCVPYSDGHKTAWKNSLMRKWLNEYFVNEAFSLEEQSNIILSEVKTNSGGWYGPMLDGGSPVQDKVFLPSVAEAILYFESTEWHDIVAEQKRITRPTYYASERGCFYSRLEYSPLKYLSAYNGNINPNQPYWHFADNIFAKKEALCDDTPENRWASNWYLRSPGNGVVEVAANGEIRSYTTKNIAHTAVRPAMWVKK